MPINLDSFGPQMKAMPPRVIIGTPAAVAGLRCGYLPKGASVNMCIGSLRCKLVVRLAAHDDRQRSVRSKLMETPLLLTRTAVNPR